MLNVEIISYGNIECIFDELPLKIKFFILTNITYISLQGVNYIMSFVFSKKKFYFHVYNLMAMKYVDITIMKARSDVLYLNDIHAMCKANFNI